MVGKEAVENGLGIVPILRMLPYILPQAMQFAVPGTMLLATVTVYGRIAASKLDGQVQTVYPRKNWSSLMVFDGANEHVRNLTVEAANTL